MRRITIILSASFLTTLLLLTIGCAPTAKLNIYSKFEDTELILKRNNVFFYLENGELVETGEYSVANRVISFNNEFPDASYTEEIIHFQEKEFSREEFPVYRLYFKNLDSSIVFDIEMGDPTPTAPNEGSLEDHYFLDWRVGDEKYSDYKWVFSDLEVNAIWRRSNTVLVDYITNSPELIDSQEVTVGSILPIPQIGEYPGYIFEGWYTNSDFSLAFDFNSAITNDIKLYAKWIQSSYTYINRYYIGDELFYTTQSNDVSNLVHPDIPLMSDKAFIGWYDKTGNKISLAPGLNEMYGYYIDFNDALLFEGSNSSSAIRVNPIYKDTIRNISVPAKYQDKDITEIADYGFNETLLSAIKLPDSIITIGRYAFASTELKAIVLPGSLTTLGQYAFNNCSLLGNATINDALSSLPANAFRDCISLSAIALPANISRIDEMAFYNCISLTSLTINRSSTQSVIKLGISVFRNTILNSIIVPDEASKMAYRTHLDWKYYTDIIHFDDGHERYIVTFAPHNGEANTIVIVRDDEYLIPLEVTKDGYYFDAWLYQGAAFSFDGFITHDLTLEGSWREIPNYQVSFTGDDITIPPLNVLENDRVDRPIDPQRHGYLFTGWSFSPEGELFDFQTQITEDILLYAIWEKLSVHTVSFQSEFSISILPVTLIDGELLEMPTSLEFEGYEFLGWSTSELEVLYFNFATPIHSSFTLYAVWRENAVASITISFDSNGGSLVENQVIPSPFIPDEPLSPTKEGFDFLGWYLNSNLTTKYNFDSPLNESTTLYAKWEEIIVESYTITFNSNGGSLVENQVIPSPFIPDEPISPTKEGFSFQGWYLNSNLTTKYNFDSPLNESTTLYAKWEEIIVESYTITFNSNGGSLVENQVIPSPFIPSEPLPPSKAAFDFLGWYLDSNLTTKYNFDSPLNESTTLYAKWESKSVNSVTISFVIKDDPTVYTKSINKGSRGVQASIPFKDGYALLGWYTNTVYTNANLFDFSKTISTSLTLYGYWISTNDILKNSSGAVSVLPSYAKSLVNIVLPSEMSGIPIDSTDWYAFADCTNLYSVKMADSIVSSRPDLFKDCTSLSRVILSTNLTNIYDEMFAGCTSLESISLPASVYSIGKRAFADCRSLISIDLHYGITIIDNEAFMNCASLLSVAIPNSIFSFGYGAFKGCTSLSNVELPDDSMFYSTIAEDTFADTSNLHSIVIPAKITAISGRAFKNSGLRSVTLENGLSYIGTEAFMNCAYLESITIPATIAAISANAFTNCVKLVSVTILRSVNSGLPNLGHEALLGCILLEAIYLPDLESIEAYGKSEYWTVYKHLMQLNR